jgi:hypothetical protein
MRWLFRRIIPFFLLCCPVFLSGQIPWDNLPVADSLLKAGNHQAALELYRPVMQYYAEKKYLLKAARCAAQTGETSLAMKYLKQMADMGWTSSRTFLFDRDLAPLQEIKKFQKLVDQVKAFEERSATFKTDALYAALDSLNKNHHQYRRQPGKEAEQARLDSLNMVRLAQLIEQHGWLGSNLLSGRNYCWLVIQHQPLEVQEKYVGLMQKAVKKGEEERHFLAYLEDAIRLAKGKKQLYGTQLDRENKLAYPLEKPEKIDILRARMGLASYQGYLAIWKIE